MRILSIKLASLVALALLILGATPLGIGTAQAVPLRPLDLPQKATIAWKLADPDTVLFENGVEMELSAVAYGDCPAGWLCLWEHSNYAGRMLKFRDAGYWQNLTNYGFNDKMSSWRNRRGLDAEWSYHTGGGGTQRCMDNGAASSSLGGDNDEASAIRIYNSTAIC